MIKSDQSQLRSLWWVQPSITLWQVYYVNKFSEFLCHTWHNMNMIIIASQNSDYDIYSGHKKAFPWHPTRIPFRITSTWKVVLHVVYIIDWYSVIKLNMYLLLQVIPVIWSDFCSYWYLINLFFVADKTFNK